MSVVAKLQAWVDHRKVAAEAAARSAAQARIEAEKIKFLKLVPIAASILDVAITLSRSDLQAALSQSAALVSGNGIPAEFTARPNAAVAADNNDNKSDADNADDNNAGDNNGGPNVALDVEASAALAGGLLVGGELVYRLMKSAHMKKRMLSMLNAVGKVRVRKPNNAPDELSTGFMIAPGVVCLSNHGMPTPELAATATITFTTVASADDAHAYAANNQPAQPAPPANNQQQPPAPRVLDFKPNILWLSSREHDEEVRRKIAAGDPQPGIILDYTICAVLQPEQNPIPCARPHMARVKWQQSVEPRPKAEYRDGYYVHVLTVVEGKAVYEKPGPIRRPLEGTSHTTLPRMRAPIHYDHDTCRSWSGGPILNRKWKLIGIHIATLGDRRTNSGIPIHNILQHANSQLTGADVTKLSDAQLLARSEFRELYNVSKLE